MKHKYISDILIALVIIIVCIFGMLHFHSAEDNEQANANRLSVVQQSSQKSLETKQARLMSLVVHQAATSKNPKLRAYGQNRLVNQEIRKPVNAFANIVYTWNNEQQYNNRKALLTPYVSPSALQTKSVFASDKDSSGNSSIKVLGEHCVENDADYGILSNNGNTVKVLLSVDFTPWEDSLNEDENSASVNQQWYTLTINKKSNQITNIDKTYHATSISE